MMLGMQVVIGRYNGEGYPLIQAYGAFLGYSVSNITLRSAKISPWGPVGLVVKLAGAVLGGKFFPWQPSLIGRVTSNMGIAYLGTVLLQTYLISSGEFSWYLVPVYSFYFVLSGVMNLVMWNDVLIRALSDATPEQVRICLGSWPVSTDFLEVYPHATLSQDSSITFVNEIGGFDDVTPALTAQVFRHLISDNDIQLNQPLSQVTLQKLLRFYDNEKPLRRTLMKLAKDSPVVQKQILTESPFDSDYLYRSNSGITKYPELHAETMNHLLKNPSAWDLVFCAKQFEVDTMYWEQVDLNQLNEIACAEYNMKALDYFDNSLLKLILKKLSQQQLENFLKMGREKHASWSVVAHVFLNKIDPKIVENIQRGKSLDTRGIEAFIQDLIPVPGFLEGCSPLALCSFMSLAENSRELVEAEVKKRLPRADCHHMMDVAVQLWQRDITHRPLLEISTIRWLASGNLTELVDLLTIIQPVINEAEPWHPPSNQEERVCWLARACALEFIPESPACLQEAVAQEPAFYGEFIGKIFPKPTSLRFVTQSLHLIDEALEIFGSAFMRVIHSTQHNIASHKGRNLTIFDQPSKDQLDFMLQVMLTESSLPKGNALIEALASTLVYEPRTYPELMTNIESTESDRLSALPDEVIQKILSYLDLRDLLRSARTCKTLYNNIVAEKGASVWRARGLGSNTATCNIVHLTRWLGGKTKTHDLTQQLPTGFDYEPRMQKVLQAVFLAAPSEILPYLDVPPFIHTARLFRKSPDNKLTLLQAGNPTMECLADFGLPWNSIQFFLSKLFEAQQEPPNTYQVFFRIVKDHPHFDLRPFFSEEEIREIDRIIEEIDFN